MNIFNHIWRIFLGDFSYLRTLFEKFTWWFSRGMIFLGLSLFLFFLHPFLGWHSVLSLFGVFSFFSGGMLLISLFYFVLYYLRK